MSNDFDWAKLADVKAGAASTEASLKKLEKAIQTLRVKDGELDEKCKLVALAAEAAGLGLAFPDNLRDSTEAYQWLARERQKLGRHTSSHSMLDAAHQIRTQHLAPIQQERQAVQATMKELEQQRQRIKNELESTQAPQLIEQHQNQLKLLQASHKKNQANVTRLNADNQTVTLELAELGLQEQQADEKLAQAIESGKPVDDADLLAIGLKRQVLSKRQQLTRQAVTKAEEATKADRTAIDQRHSEISRLKALIQSTQIRKAIADVVDQLAKDYSRAAIIDQMKLFK